MANSHALCGMLIDLDSDHGEFSNMVFFIALVLGALGYLAAKQCFAHCNLQDAAQAKCW